MISWCVFMTSKTCLTYIFVASLSNAHLYLENCSIYTDIPRHTILIWFFWCIIILFQNGRICSMDFHSKSTNYLVTASDDESIRLYDTQDAVWVRIITVFGILYLSKHGHYWFFLSYKRCNFLHSCSSVVVLSSWHVRIYYLFSVS